MAHDIRVFCASYYKPIDNGKQSWFVLHVGIVALACRFTQLKVVM